MKKNIRQGDVLLVEVDSIPNGEESSDGVLALGEVTGHKHKLVGKFVRINCEDGKTYLKVENAVLYHGTESQIERQQLGEVINTVKEDIHAPQTIVGKILELIIQKDYEPEGWKKVSD